MADHPRSPSAASKPSRTIRSQKISTSSPSTEQRYYERGEAQERGAPPNPGRSHTPGHLSSKSHGGSAAAPDRRRKTSDTSIRLRSQSVATKSSFSQQPPSASHPVPLPSNLRSNNGGDDNSSSGSSSIGSGGGGGGGSRPRDSQAGPSSSSNSRSGTAKTDPSTATTDSSSRRTATMRSTSAIISKANNTTSQLPHRTSAITPSARTSRGVQKQQQQQPPYIPYPELQDPATAPDVPAAPTSGMYWSRAPTSGHPQAPLRAHTTTLVGSNIFVFGGCDARTCFNELRVLDADSFHWSAPQVFGDAPAPLRAMTCTAIANRRLVVFGGGDGPAYYNDVYVLDTVNFRWHRPRIVSSPSSSGGGGGSATSSGAGGNNSNSNKEGDAESAGGGSGSGSNAPLMPSPRRAHTACLYKNGIYVFGGGDGVRALNDIWRLDVSDPHKMSWKLISAPTTGSSGTSSSGAGSGSGSSKDGTGAGAAAGGLKAPKARGYHTANMVGSKLIIFGGSDGGECFNDVWVYDVEGRSWRAVHVPVTFRRLSHTSTLVGSYLFVVGGHDGTEYSNDVLLLNLVTMAWDRRRVYGLPPAGRGYHGAVLYDSRLVVVGGFDGGEVFGDVWILELAVHAYYSQISHFTIEV
ncbi:hypothetical protein SLS62_006884 [Diatrype stigma]|uniref:Uncharacterized protein n=1 Tax=Diatrype stigma TaxID=117547 RepID=A0AAN9UXS1_9PEZI